MVFSSLTFIYWFIPVVLIIYFAVPRKYKNAVLLFASLLFYAWGEQLLVFLFFGTIVTGWISARLIESKPIDSKLRKVIFIMTLVLDLGLLAWFKYMDFMIENLNLISGLSIPLLKVTLPIGISFYTFQLISYTVDVYRGRVAASKNLIDFAAYVSMFPQLIAGPIVRYQDVEKALTNRKATANDIAYGIRRFVIGLGKKVLIANMLAEVVASFKSTLDPSVLYYWVYIICLCLQIYFDFSGYSDMAIGLGKILGFSFPENFNYPYIAASITDFWRRWHMTLGTWFRDYVYIPLGGNRKGFPRQILNILIVWMLTGLWHGASWNFVLWGLYFAILLIIEKALLAKWLTGHKIISHIYVIAAVMISFVIFDGTGITGILNNIKNLFGFNTVLPVLSKEALYILRSNAVLMGIAIIGATPLPRRLFKKSVLKLPFIEPLILGILLLISTACLVDGSFNPFLYFRF